MNKIPVLATIRDAYGFTFRHLGAIIGAIWLPMVVLTVAGFFAVQSFFGSMIDTLTGANPAALGSSLLMLLVYLIASLLLYAMMYVAVTQLALGTRQGGAMLHFAFGAPERRVFRSLIALVGVFTVLIFGAMMTVLAVNLALSATGLKVAPVQTTMLLTAAIYAILAVAVPRFVLPLPAIAVAEEGPVLRRAWELSAGNGLRLLAITVAVFGPGLLIMQVADALLPGGGGAVVTGSQQVQTIAILQRERAVMPAVSGIAFFVSPVTLGLVVGASVAAWRALTGQADKSL